MGAIIQVDNVQANKLLFNNLNNGTTGYNAYFNGVYISTGPIDTSGQLSYFADMSTPLSVGYNPYNPATAQTNFLPAFQTIADMGVTTYYHNYFDSLSPANLTTAGLPASSVPNNGILIPGPPAPYSKIDSGNSTITTLAQRFNGNFVDGNTGFIPMTPGSMPAAMLRTLRAIRRPSTLTLIEAPSAAPG